MNLTEYFRTWNMNNPDVPVIDSTEKAVALAHQVEDLALAKSGLFIMQRTLLSVFESSMDTSLFSLDNLIIVACDCQFIRETIEEIDSILLSKGGN